MMIQFQFYDGGMWFRVFGRGLSIVNRKKHPEPFSVRYGKTLRVFGWTVNYLRKQPMSAPENVKPPPRLGDRDGDLVFVRRGWVKVSELSFTDFMKPGETDPLECVLAMNRRVIYQRAEELQEKMGFRSASEQRLP